MTIRALRSKVTWTMVRLSIWLGFWTVVVGWILQPEQPSHFFRSVWFTGLVVMVLAAAIGPVRRALRRRGRRTLRVFEVVTVNAILLVLFAEIAVITLATLIDSPVLAFHDADADEIIRHHRYPSHGIHNGHACNELGLVDEEFELQRRTGRKRVVVLGDSFAVAAVTYAQNFLTLLDAKLDGRSGQVDVLNFGVSNCGLPEYLHLWRTEAAQYDPDLVLLCFFVGNDFLPKRIKRRSLLHASSMRAITLVDRLWRARKWGGGLQHDSETPDPNAPTLPAEMFRRLMKKRLVIYGKATEEELLRRFTPTFEALDEIHASIGDRLRIAIIPEESQVSDPLFASLTGEQHAQFDRTMPNRYLTGHLTNQGIPWLDLFDMLREAERTARTYKPRDTHWNARGNALAADALAVWLRPEFAK